ncbi:TetR/AcrR family transcriptional regulator [Dactylosporangium aurantiacum]|uniref:TetR/AcrR family transcriptional regulator n=1 Tax=Dactylosporangium aurantiacum TaxID=35754 RepID=A0A9Q9IK15_9ACTN|nr:TetR/AcrR family transcriptional regulator [Dactylosporangium aurantiacum]MDG6107378.1 TetR/AcrR family transcriptional regulator [Dactylosporangium aurantiacum]UWZ54493.1 TetR/AcrR family transcriptional regulator [Dactylosporangium aurantiacum]
MTATRDRIVEAAATLLNEGGREAISTRAVSAAAGVQAPTIYRLFGDKQGLLDAVASHGFVSYLSGKMSLEHSEDAVEDLRRGWDLHVAFGLAHPAVYTLIYGEPRPGVESPAARAAAEILAGQVRRIAAAGRLRVSEERAAHLIHAAGCGLTLTLIALPPQRRDPALSVLARESVLAAVTSDPPPAADAPAAASAGPAEALRAVLPEVTVLSDAERALLDEWLTRIARG